MEDPVKSWVCIDVEVIWLSIVNLIRIEPKNDNFWKIVYHLQIDMINQKGDFKVKFRKKIYRIYVTVTSIYLQIFWSSMFSDVWGRLTGGCEGYFHMWEWWRIVIVDEAILALALREPPQIVLHRL